ncbi:hypothetical protein DLJ53_19145 [Acuticoccus sediminis]|uniref:mRNA interferase MazF n=1 Tax=Acuticoccus sediminis TaxID=2184697 RepID=A0A8B2NR98_9HYPH|nr:hypothetical protein DLJ53_19145 [Acuticoccus sediminis]
MPLTYYPSPGEIVLCNYDSGFVPPEMVKKRPVVVVSPRLRRRADLVAVVPLSTTPPAGSPELHQCGICLAEPLPRPFENPVMWAKCDMVATVALSRLDRFRERNSDGRRIYRTGRVTEAHLLEIRKGILHGLGLGSLTKHF